MAEGRSPDGIYPLAERLSYKIRYARERWGCTLFHIDYNGAWRRPAPDRNEAWMNFDARVLKIVREQHPDVLRPGQLQGPHLRAERNLRLLGGAPRIGVIPSSHPSRE